MKTLRWIDSFIRSRMEFRRARRLIHAEPDFTVQSHDFVMGVSGWRMSRSTIKGSEVVKEVEAHIRTQIRAYLFRWGVPFSGGYMVDKNAKVTLPSNVITSGRDDIGLWIETETSTTLKVDVETVNQT